MGKRSYNVDLSALRGYGDNVNVDWYEGTNRSKSGSYTGYDLAASNWRMQCSTNDAGLALVIAPQGINGASKALTLGPNQLHTCLQATDINDINTFTLQDVTPTTATPVATAAVTAAAAAAAAAEAEAAAGWPWWAWVLAILFIILIIWLIWRCFFSPCARRAAAGVPVTLVPTTPTIPVTPIPTNIPVTPAVVRI